MPEPIHAGPPFPCNEGSAHAKKWEKRVPSCTYLVGDRLDGNGMTVPTILVTAPNLVTENEEPIQTPFTKFHAKPDGNGFYLQFNVGQELIVQQFIHSLKILSSHWFIGS